MGDEVRVTVIAAGFDRWEEERQPAADLRSSRRDERDRGERSARSAPPPRPDPFAMPADEDIDLGDDDFDVPSFLR